MIGVDIKIVSNHAYLHEYMVQGFVTQIIS